MDCRVHALPTNTLFHLVFASKEHHVISMYSGEAGTRK